MVRPVTEDDIGLEVLREAPTEAVEAHTAIDIVAIHGLGAHPDDTWCKNVGTDENPRWFNWLKEETMLPAKAPNARIMRYGYQSQWFGTEAMRQSVSTVAERLLKALRRKRKGAEFRPVLFIAHCFGGLVVLKLLVEAEHYQSEWPGLYWSTTGLIFFGTPFRGAEGMNQMELLEAARRQYDDKVQPAVLNVLQAGNDYLRDLLDNFMKNLGRQNNKTHIACFYELTSTNVGKIVGDRDQMKFVVSEGSGCLDLSSTTKKHSLSRTHFNMNKFSKPTEEDFEEVADVVETMVMASHTILSARSQNHSMHKVPFDIKNMPTLGKFVPRDEEMQRLVQVLVEKTVSERRKVVVLHGLGGIGKTQLAVEFARNYHYAFSSIFWLNGESEISLKQSFVTMLHRLPPEELTKNGVEALGEAAIDVDVAMRECLSWLSLETNNDWLLIFDNVDRDCNDKDDSQAYNPKNYFPSTDSGSIFITTRLASLQRLGSGLKIRTVTADQAREILEKNAGKSIKSEITFLAEKPRTKITTNVHFTDGEVILQRLSGLPLALAQAGSYIQETNVSALKYAQHYDRTWETLMQNQGQFPSEEYGDRNILTTWTISYEQVKRKNEKAAWLLKLWGFLDHSELWHGLITAALQLKESISTPVWLMDLARHELAYSSAIGLLSRYSLADTREDNESHSMHSVLHRWCGRLEGRKAQHDLMWLSAGLVAFAIPSDFRLVKRKRLFGHAVAISEWLREMRVFKKPNAAIKKYRTMICSKLGNLLLSGGRLEEAEIMYQQALPGYGSEILYNNKAIAAPHGRTHPIQGIQKIIQTMEMRYSTKSQENKTVKWLGNFSARFKQYDQVLHVLAPDHSTYSPLMWGALKMLFTAAKRHDHVIQEMTKALSTINDVLPHVQAIEQFAQTDEMRDLTLQLYMHIVHFLMQAWRFYDNSSQSATMIRIVRPFEFDYKNTIEAIRSCASQISQVSHREVEHTLQPSGQLGPEDLAVLTAQLQANDHMELSSSPFPKVLGQHSFFELRRSDNKHRESPSAIRDINQGVSTQPNSDVDYPQTGAEAGQSRSGHGYSH